MFTNCRSIWKKMDEIVLLLQRYRPAMLGIAETWLDSDVDDSDIRVEGYNVLRCDRRGQSYGGVLLYLRND